MGRNAVPDRVFDQGLQDQAGDFRIQGPRVDLEDYFQAIAKANSFNLQIPVEKIEFALQRNPLCGGVLQRESQKIAKTGDQAHGCLRLIGHQVTKRMERVEDEVGLQLHLKRPKTRLGQLNLQLGAAEVLQSNVFVVIRCRDNGNNH